MNQFKLITLLSAIALMLCSSMGCLDEGEEKEKPEFVNYYYLGYQANYSASFIFSLMELDLVFAENGFIFFNPMNYTDTMAETEYPNTWDPPGMDYRYIYFGYGINNNTFEKMYGIITNSQEDGGSYVKIGLFDKYKHSAIYENNLNKDQILEKRKVYLQKGLEYIVELISQATGEMPVEQAYTLEVFEKQISGFSFLDV